MAMGKLLVLGAVGLFMYYQHQKKQKAKFRPQQQQIGYQQGPPQQQQQGGNHHYGAMAAGAAGIAGVAAAGYYAHQHSGGGGGGGGVNPNDVLQVLKNAVRDQKITAFFPSNLDKALQPLAEKVARSGAIEYLAREWDLPMNVALDLSKLALFDVVLYLDDSGSMSFEENGRRIDDLRLIVSKVSECASLFDQNGIQVRFMNAHIEGNNITNEQTASALLNRLEFKYQTPLGTALKSRVLDPLVVEPAKKGRLQKPVYVICVTDGEPGGEDRGMLRQVIAKTNKKLRDTKYGPDAVSYQLAQVGGDRRARDFLSEIDTDREVGHLVDVTSNYEYEAEELSRGNPPINLTAILWLVKILLGGIDSSMDSTDERGGKMKSRLAAAGAMQDYAWSDTPSNASPAPPAYGQPPNDPYGNHGYGQKAPQAQPQGYPQQQNYPPQQDYSQNYPPQQQQGYPPQNSYPPQNQTGAYPPSNSNYPPQNSNYPPQSQGGFPQGGGGGFPQPGFSQGGGGGGGGFPDPNAYGAGGGYGGGAYPPQNQNFYGGQGGGQGQGQGFPGQQQQQQGGGNGAWVPSMPNSGNSGYGY